MIRCLVVEDEPLARQRVRDLLEPYSDFEIAGECETGHEAIEQIERLQPDVVFLDIQMPEIDGFAMLRELTAPPMIVFTTAYAEHAVQAFDEHAVDYLLKPLDGRRFHDSVARVRKSLANRYLKRLTVRDTERIRFVDTRDVEWFEAAGNYVRLHMNGTRLLVRMTLQSLEQRLDPRSFARVHRGSIVNVQRIEEVQRRWRGESLIVLKSGAEVMMQRRYRERLNAAMGDI